MTKTLARLVLVVLALAVALTAVAAPKPRARDLGIPFDGTTGPLDAITHVSGIEVGFTTLIFGGSSDPKGGPQVRTGVTAVLPRGKTGFDPVFAGYFSQNRQR